jgi:hypothetical protein
LSQENNQKEEKRKEWRGKALRGKGFITCHTKLCHFGKLIILSWRYLRNSRCRKSSLPLLPKSMF